MTRTFRRGLLTLGTLALCALALSGNARAQSVDTVNWAADATTDGTGTGTLAGGTITVTYSTIPAAGNAGITIGDNWNVAPATDGAVGTGVTNQTGGVFGTLSSLTGVPPLSFAQAIQFSSNVTNPILYVNFSDATTTMDFGTQTLTLLDSNNAQLAGNIISFVGSTNGFGDGFAAQVNGTFGPGTPIQFTYFSSGSVSGFDSVGFTVGVPLSAVPEPGSIALLFGLVSVGGMALRRRKK